MPPVAVVTDSTHYTPHELFPDGELHVVSLYVNRGGELERELDLDFTEFYDRLKAASDLPTTSQPSIGDFLAVYTPLLQAGRDIVSIHIAGGISGTLESARQAATEAMAAFPDRRVEVVDSTSGCATMGYVVLCAHAVASTGAGVEQVADRAREAAAVVRLWFLVDTLEYLRRGGRIGGAQAWLGGALKIKPILTLTEEITPVERVRTAGRAFDRMVDYLRRMKENGSDGWIVQHVQAPDLAARMADAGREVFGTEPLFVSEIGPVIGSHIGPGVLGIGGGPARLLQP
jgi:DegV family protein with EDD domain